MNIEIKGRLYGKNVLDGVFRAAPDEDLFLGELLVAVDDTTGRRYLFRVVDVTYGTEHREPGWAERVAGTLLADDRRGDPGAHPLHEQERRTYRVASCRCLGYLTPGEAPEFRKPKSLPTQFSRVLTPEPADFAFRIDLPASADPEEALGALSAVSDDAAFPGYPYPLSVADQLAACPPWLRQELWLEIDELFHQAGVPLEVRERAFTDRHALMERA